MRPLPAHALAETVCQPDELACNFSRRCFYGFERTVGAYFYTAITSDATVIVESDDSGIGCDGFGRAILPAFPAQPAGIAVDSRALHEMFANQPLETLGAERQWAENRKSETGYGIEITKED